MTHVLLDESIVPVPTQHGDCHVSTGVTEHGVHVVVLIGAGPENTDLHLTFPQAMDMAATVVHAAMKLLERGQL